MPAQLNQDNGNGTYLHIYNKGVENRNIFNEDQDYEVFLNFLEEYLTLPPDPEKRKKTFNVNGRVFQGIPHLPQNYYNKVDLIAYGLKNNHFHLIIKEITKGSVEKLVRSLSTRYAIYYNKKNKRKGSLFQGPYKSVRLENPNLIYLTRYLHRECNIYSSYKVYSGEKIVSWVKPNTVLSCLEKAAGYHSGEPKTAPNSAYKDFVENNIPQEYEEIIKSFNLEDIAEHTKQQFIEPEKTNTDKIYNFGPGSEPKIKLSSYISASLIIFLLLFGLGIKNINTPLSYNKYANSITSTPTSQVSVAKATPFIYPLSPTPEVAGIETTEIIEDINPETKKMVVINIGKDSENVNLRLDPTDQSEIIGKAKNGEVYELVSEADGWFQIRLIDGTLAFVSSGLVQIVEEEDN